MGPATEDPAFQWIGSYEGNGENSGYFVQNNVYTYRLSFRWGSEDAQSVNVEARVGWVSTALICINYRPANNTLLRHASHCIDSCCCAVSQPLFSAIIGFATSHRALVRPTGHV